MCSYFNCKQSYKQFNKIHFSCLQHYYIILANYCRSTNTFLQKIEAGIALIALDKSDMKQSYDKYTVDRIPTMII